MTVVTLRHVVHVPKSAFRQLSNKIRDLLRITSQSPYVNNGFVDKVGNKNSYKFIVQKDMFTLPIRRKINANVIQK